MLEEDGVHFSDSRRWRGAFARDEEGKVNQARSVLAWIVLVLTRGNEETVLIPVRVKADDETNFNISVD